MDSRPSVGYLEFGSRSFFALDSRTNVGLNADFCCCKSQLWIDCLVLPSILQKTAARVSEAAWTVGGVSDRLAASWMLFGVLNIPSSRIRYEDCA